MFLYTICWGDFSKVHFLYKNDDVEKENKKKTPFHLKIILTLLALCSGFYGNGERKYGIQSFRSEGEMFDQSISSSFISVFLFILNVCRGGGERILHKVKNGLQLKVVAAR